VNARRGAPGACLPEEGFNATPSNFAPRLGP
jgi:hypothetical protein